jgi:hypothetical protein
MDASPTCHWYYLSTWLLDVLGQIAMDWGIKKIYHTKWRHILEYCNVTGHEFESILSYIIIMLQSHFSLQNLSLQYSFFQYQSSTVELSYNRTARDQFFFLRCRRGTFHADTYKILILETADCRDRKVLRYRHVSIMHRFRLRQVSLYISRLSTCAYRWHIRDVSQIFQILKFDSDD